MHAKYEEIKHAYRELHKEFLKTAPFLIKYYDEHVWAPSILKEIYRIFDRYRDRSKTFLDLGSGDGLAVMTASLFFKHSYGVEINEEFFNISKEMEGKLGIRNTTFIRDDFHNVDLSKYDIIFIAPDKPFTLKLENKLSKEMRGKLIVYSSIFQPKTLRKTEQFETHHFDVSVYENRPKKV